MASLLLKSNFHTDLVDDKKGQLGAVYDLRYDPKNGNVELVNQGAGLLGNPGVILFQNGDWTPEGLKIIPVDIIRNNYKNQIQNDVRSAHTSVGGNAANNILPSWAKASQQAGSPLPPAPGYPGLTDGNILFDLPDPDDLPFKFGDVDDVIEKMKNPLNYPEDALYNKTQDHLSIAQYRYTPPRSNDIFGDALNTLQNGSKRISPLKKLLGMVNLPMPNNITDSNNVSWGDDNMNSLSAALTSYVAKNALLTTAGALALNAGAGAAGVGGAQTASLIMALTNMGALDPNNTTPEMKTLLGGSINSRILSMLGVSVSPESILARGYGIVPNSNLELLFNAPTLREFTFQYRMSPRSNIEAKIVNNIIRFFKQGMAAKKIDGKAGAQSYFLGTPNVFQLQYKTTGGKTIKGVNRIKTCALTGFAMNYAADGNWAAYDDGQPVSVIMNMSFKELEPVYDTDYQEDIFDGRKFTGKDGSGDLYPITPDEVGY